jgi:hypothetical protein
MKFCKFNQLLALLFACTLVSATAYSQSEWSVTSPEIFVNTLNTSGNPSTLTVSGESQWFQQSFDAQEVVELPIQNNKGELLSDGHYRFELRIFYREKSQVAEQSQIIGSYTIASGNFVSMRTLK